MSISSIKYEWTAKILKVVAELTTVTDPMRLSCSFPNEDLAHQAIQEAAFKFLEPNAERWGVFGGASTCQATFADGSTVRHEIVITIKEGPGRKRYTADLLLDGQPYRAVAM